MARYLILLRGVNVGKAKRLPMAGLRELLTGLGMGSVVTLLNSGNAVAEWAGTSVSALEDRIREAITERFGFEVPVVVVSAAGLETIVQGNALAAHASDPSRLLVAFSGSARDLEGLQDLENLIAHGEQFLRTAHAAYLHCPGGILESRAAKALLGRTGQALTTRNWATVLKLQALMKEGRSPGRQA